ncbi:hypothetical protein FGIG_00141 [Fasciola gigantica]|uniref:Uncharacterized protein n=1 Tax=Fasciola gigantica TaxID=46835 RepID=A0A504YZL8_FASGI|nr:hypothetical protein FGIG_00141 [Fasciola gigantica]
MRESSETLEDFLHRLRSHVRSCEYTDVLEDKIEGVMLVQQLISGGADSHIRECLLTEDRTTLMWDRAVEIARTEVLATEQSKTFNVCPQTHDISKIHKSRPETGLLQKCLNCGSFQIAQLAMRSSKLVVSEGRMPAVVVLIKYPK